MIVPSRFESMPYVVLEAAGCGQPLISTNVGGIPEIFGPDRASLVEPGDAVALEAAMHAALLDEGGRWLPEHSACASASWWIFSAARMTETVLAGYRRGFAAMGLAPKGGSALATARLPQALTQNIAPGSGIASTSRQSRQSHCPS